MSLVSSIVSLASGVIGLIAYDKQTSYRDKLYDLRKKILDEEFKPVSDQNDAALEKWYKDLEITLEALALEPLNVQSNSSPNLKSSGV